MAAAAAVLHKRRHSSALLNKFCKINNNKSGSGQLLIYGMPDQCDEDEMEVSTTSARFAMQSSDNGVV